MKKRLINGIILFMIYILFIYIYIGVISPNFNYGFMSFQANFNEERNILIITLTIFLVLLTFLIKSSFIYCIYIIYLSYIYFPTSIYYIFNDVNFMPTFTTVILLMFLFIFNKVKIAEFKEINSKNLIDRKKWIKILFGVSLILFIPFLVTYSGSISLRNLSFENLYTTREELSNLAFPFQAYIQSPLTRVIVPILLILSIREKNKKMILYSSCVILFMFLSSALKSTFLILILIFVFYFCKTYYQTVRLYLYGILIVSIASCYEFFVLKSNILIDSIIRRVFFVPPMLDKFYYGYFDNNHLWWSYTRLGDLWGDNNEYGRAISRYVGMEVIGGERLNANVGILTEGFSSAGILGVIIMASILTFIFVYLNSVTISPQYFGMVFFYIYILNTSFIETSLLTHGLLYLLIAAPIFMKFKHEESFDRLRRVI